MNLLLTVILNSLLFTGLNGYSGGDCPGGCLQYKEGFVRNYDAMGKGCEWLVEIDGKLFRPKNLQEGFRKDGLKVKIDFEYSLSMFKCPEMNESVQEVSITWIEVSTVTKPGEKQKAGGDVNSGK
jgi:hypothetical protein